MIAVVKLVKAPCAMCAGRGCEPFVDDGEIRSQPCWWCEGEGEVDVPDGVPPCPHCGRQQMWADGAYCPTCTRFTSVGGNQS